VLLVLNNAPPFAPSAKNGVQHGPAAGRGRSRQRGRTSAGRVVAVVQLSRTGTTERLLPNAPVPHCDAPLASQHKL
jgi:hypothetical protein